MVSKATPELTNESLAQRLWREADESAVFYLLCTIVNLKTQKIINKKL